MMTPFLVCLVTVLCLPPVSGVSQGNSGDCLYICSLYFRDGYQCALRNRCPPPHSDEAKLQCYVRCMQPYQDCPPLCAEHSNRIAAICQARCSGANPFCERRCFSEEMEEILPKPPRPAVSLLQGVPVLGRERREAKDDSTERVAPRDDSNPSWDSSSSEEFGDLFNIWRKKRDSNPSWDSSSSEEFGDLFNIWRKKRDSNPSLDSWSSEDLDDLFDTRRKKRDSNPSWDSWSSEDLDDLFDTRRKKRDTNPSWDSWSSEDLDDLFDTWRKKRDSNPSWDSWSSEDVDDLFDTRRKKRDSKRSPGSTNSEDFDEIFGNRRRGQDWVWEEGNSENDVYGDWQDKRQAETEIQPQKW